MDCDFTVFSDEPYPITTGKTHLLQPLPRDADLGHIALILRESKHLKILTPFHIDLPFAKGVGLVLIQEQRGSCRPVCLGDDPDLGQTRSFSENVGTTFLGTLGILIYLHGVIIDETLTVQVAEESPGCPRVGLDALWAKLILLLLGIGGFRYLLLL